MTKKQMLGYLGKVQGIQRASNVNSFHVSTYRNEGEIFICVSIQRREEDGFEHFNFYGFRSKEENDETLKNLLKCASENG